MSALPLLLLPQGPGKLNELQGNIENLPEIPPGEGKPVVFSALLQQEELNTVPVIQEGLPVVLPIQGLAIPHDVVIFADQPDHLPTTPIVFAALSETDQEAVTQVLQSAPADLPFVEQFVGLPAETLKSLKDTIEPTRIVMQTAPEDPLWSQELAQHVKQFIEQNIQENQVGRQDQTLQEEQKTPLPEVPIIMPTATPTLAMTPEFQPLQPSAKLPEPLLQQILQQPESLSKVQESLLTEKSPALLQVQMEPKALGQMEMALISQKQFSYAQLLNPEGIVKEKLETLLPKLRELISRQSETLTGISTANLSTTPSTPQIQLPENPILIPKTTSPVVTTSTGGFNSFQLSSSFSDPQWGQRFSERLLWMSGNNIHGAKIHVNPPELGPLDVRIHVHDNAANVQIVTHQAVVRDALEQALPRLREMFEEQGLQLTDANISDQSREGLERERTLAQGGTTGGEAEGESSETRAPVWLNQGNGLVDYFA